MREAPGDHRPLGLLIFCAPMLVVDWSRWVPRKKSVVAAAKRLSHRSYLIVMQAGVARRASLGAIRTEDVTTPATRAILDTVVEGSG